MARRKWWIFPVSDAERQAMKRMYEVDRLALQAIADYFGLSKAAIHKTLKKLGVDTSKAVGCHVQMRCHYCEKPISPTRSRLKWGGTNHYCDQECYYAYIRSGDAYLPNRQAQRIGRGTVEKLYGPLPEGSVVHHIDRNTYNNDPGNLMLFACHADHLRWHRGDRSKVTPIWVGK